MIRYIPGKTRIKTEFFKNITLGDIVLGIVCLIFAIVIVASNLFKIGGMDYRWYALFTWIGFTVALYLPIDEGLRLWSSVTMIIRFSAFAKKYHIDEKKKGYKPMNMITPFFKIDMGKYIDFGSYAGMVLEIQSIALDLMQEKAQDMIIRTFSKALKRISKYQRASIIKTVKPMRFDIFLKNDDQKFQLLNELYDRGQYSELEMEMRSIIFRERVDALNNAIKAEPILQNHFYFVLFGEDRTALEETTIGIMNDLGTGQYTIQSQILQEKELVAFLKSNYTDVFAEKDIDNLAISQYNRWIMPNQVEFKVARLEIDKKPYKQMVISNYPLEVGNGWAYPIFNQDKTRVIMNILPVDKEKGEKAIDRAVMEKEAKLEKTFRSSEMIEKQADIETLQALLQDLKTNNEQLFDVSIHIRVEEENRKEEEENKTCTNRFIVICYGCWFSILNDWIICR